jgi:acyl-CoA synthetase (NDP forming)
VAVPSTFVVKVVEECVNKGVKIVHAYSAGFTEMDSEKGAIRQEQLEALINVQCFQRVDVL